MSPDGVILYGMQLRGCGTALVTPFRADGLDRRTRSAQPRRLAGRLRHRFSGSLRDYRGNSDSDPREWLKVIDITIEVVAGRVPIVAGATSNSTHDAVAKAKEVAARPGVDAILTASPYYNKPTQEGQYRHFRAIAEAVDKPIMLYNVPGRTGANIEAGNRWARLAEVPNIARGEGSQRQHVADRGNLQPGAGAFSGLLWRRCHHVAGDRTWRCRASFRSRRMRFPARWPR